MGPGANMMFVDGSSASSEPGAARHRFLADGVADNALVPAEIVRSWERSRRVGADPEALPVPYEPEQVDTASRFCDAALPVLRHFAGLLDGTPTCLVLADREARGIETWVGEKALQRNLDRLGALPGFRFSEDVAGTNGLGTPVETGRPIAIGPGQHYSEALQPLACAGVPVRHPLTRRLEAVIDLTCAHDDPNRLLMPMAREIARQVEDSLYARSTLTEQALLAHFLAATRASSNGIVVVSPDMVMANGPASRLIDGIPQALLWEQAARAVRDRSSAVYELDPGDGALLLVRATPVTNGSTVIGAALELEREAHGPVGPGPAARPPRLPGLAGRSVAWRRVSGEGRRLMAAPGRTLLVITGEAGTGKLAVARALLDGRSPVIVDGALETANGLTAWIEALRAHLEHSDPVILRHLDCLSGAAVRAVVALVDSTPDGAPLIATLVLGERPLTHCAPVLARLSHLELPPLRQRPEDIGDITAAIVAQIDPARRLSPETLQVLTRFTWPGNLQQLETAVRHGLAQRAAGDLHPEDLPIEVRRGGPGRRLTPMEQAELDAILAALTSAGGNKVEAAIRLGISRSTLYRKLAAFGLDGSVL